MDKQGFDGLMLANVRQGLQIKKDKRIKNMSLNVIRADGKGMEKVVFQQVEEHYVGSEYIMTGTCTIKGIQHSFEHSAPIYGLHNSSIIGFLPVKEKVSVP